MRKVFICIILIMVFNGCGKEEKQLSKLENQNTGNKFKTFCENNNTVIFKKVN